MLRNVEKRGVQAAFKVAKRCASDGRCHPTFRHFHAAIQEFLDALPTRCSQRPVSLMTLVFPVIRQRPLMAAQGMGAAGSTQFLAPGKRGWPPISTPHAPCRRPEIGFDFLLEFALFVSDRPSRLFSAQQETVQRSPGWDWICTFVVAKCGRRDAASCRSRNCQCLQ
jgi:hypothetical protein